MEKTALPSGKVFDEEFGEVADIEWVYRVIEITELNLLI